MGVEDDLKNGFVIFMPSAKMEFVQRIEETLGQTGLIVSRLNISHAGTLIEAHGPEDLTKDEISICVRALKDAQCISNADYFKIKENWRLGEGTFNPAKIRDDFIQQATEMLGRVPARDFGNVKSFLKNILEPRL